MNSVAPILEKRDGQTPTDLEANAPKESHSCSSAAKISLLIIGLLLGAIAIVAHLQGIGGISPNIVIGGCSLLAITTAIIIHFTQSSSQTSSIEASQPRDKAAKAQVVVGAKKTAADKEIPPLVSLLQKENVVSELDSTHSLGIILKEGESSDWDNLEKISLAFENTPDLFLPCSPKDWEKNRYSNILPFPQNSYVFQADKKRYINASDILSGTYILTQGPKSNTVEDFWEMVWDSGADTVVMATDQYENEKEKCAQYWPSSTSETLTFPSISVSLEQSREVESDSTKFTLRQLSLQKGNEIRRPRQFQFRGWPDHAVHPSLDLIEIAIRLVNLRHKKNGPHVIHCSAGVGRSGVFLCCHLLHQLNNYCLDNKKALEIDIYALITLLRTPPYGRHKTVMTEEQYQMIYDFGQHLNNKETTG